MNNKHTQIIRIKTKLSNISNNIYNYSSEQMGRLYNGDVGTVHDVLFRCTVHWYYGMLKTNPK